MIPTRLIALALALAALPAAGDQTRPDVLFIAVDDLNDYISPLGNFPGIKTPNFDRLAERTVTLIWLFVCQMGKAYL